MVLCLYFFKNTYFEHQVISTTATGPMLAYLKKKTNYAIVLLCTTDEHQVITTVPDPMLTFFLKYPIELQVITKTLTGPMLAYLKKKTTM